MRLKVSLGFALLGMAWQGVAADENALSPLRIFSAWEVGQVEQFRREANVVDQDKELINRANVWLLQEARLADNARAFVGVGGAYFFVYPRNLGGNPYAHSKRSAFGLTDAHGEFTFLSEDEENYWLRLKVGIFPYKYNPDAKNLGEYMFRTWTYPTVINTGGLELSNSAATQLSGGTINTQIGGFKNDLLLTIQSDRPPIFSLSLTDIASYRLGIVTLGAGVMFDSFYNPDEEAVQPMENTGNAYHTLSDGRKMANKELQDLMNQGLLDTAVTKIVDTSYYTMAGTKLMGRAALDLGFILPEDMRSPEDMRFYFEAILMGWKDYPTYYEKRADRVAYTLGVNIPTFGLLDVLSLEWEKSPNPFSQSTENVYKNGIVLPISPGTFPVIKPEHRDDNKWTLYARRQLFDKAWLHAQVANDHLRMVGVFSENQDDQALLNPTHWYWVLKLSYSI